MIDTTRDTGLVPHVLTHGSMNAILLQTVSRVRFKSRSLVVSVEAKLIIQPAGSYKVSL